MLIGNPIGCFTHVECRKKPITASFSGHYPVWVLVAESNEAASDIIAGVPLDFTAFQLLDQAFEYGLLHELHAGWLDSNDPWGFQRFRYGYNPYGSFRLRLEEGDTIELLMKSGAREDGFQEWKQTLQPSGPFDLHVLLVTQKSIGR